MVHPRAGGEDAEPLDVATPQPGKVTQSRSLCQPKEPVGQTGASPPWKTSPGPQQLQGAPQRAGIPAIPCTNSTALSISSVCLHKIIFVLTLENLLPLVSLPWVLGNVNSCSCSDTRALPVPNWER